MPTVVNEQTLDAVNAVNVKNGMEMVSTAQGLATQNQVSLQARINEIASEALQQTLLLSRQATADALAFSQAVTARAVRMVFDISAEEAVGFAKETAADLSGKLADFGAQLAHLQEQAKIANTTPPQTGTGGAFGSDAGSALLQQLGNIEALLQTLVAAQAKPGG